MSKYLFLERISIQQANCVAGLTYGFPAITNFLGYAHALSRQTQPEFGIQLTGCMVFCHEHQIHAHKSDDQSESVFALTRNPLTKEGKDAPIVENGRMNMVISLIVECEGELPSDTSALIDRVFRFVYSQNLASGQVVDIRSISVHQGEEDALSRRLLRRVMPGFALIDRSELLCEHLKQLQKENAEATQLDAWLNFSALTYKSSGSTSEPDTKKASVHWEYAPKPARGYLVPIMTGYKAISGPHPAGAVRNSRDNSCPFSFVESVHGVGQWINPNSIKTIKGATWRYHHDGAWYVGKTLHFETRPSVHPEQMESNKSL